MLESIVDKCTGGNYSSGPFACFVDQNEVSIDLISDAVNGTPNSISIKPISICTPVHPNGLFVIREDPTMSENCTINCHDDLLDLAETVNAIGEPVSIFDEGDKIRFKIEEDDGDQHLNSEIQEFLNAYRDQIDVIGGDTPDDFTISIKNRD